MNKYCTHIYMCIHMCIYTCTYTCVSMYIYIMNVYISTYIALADVAQWIERWPANQRVAGSIPSQGTCLGFGLGL